MAERNLPTSVIPESSFLFWLMDRESFSSASFFIPYGQLRLIMPSTTDFVSLERAWSSAGPHHLYIYIQRGLIYIYSIYIAYSVSLLGLITRHTKNRFQRLTELPSSPEIFLISRSPCYFGFRAPGCYLNFTAGIYIYIGGVECIIISVRFISWRNIFVQTSTRKNQWII